MSALDNVKAEAKRFLGRIAEYERAKKDGDVNAHGPDKHRAAIKRASMDLTRALAELRKAGAS